MKSTLFSILLAIGVLASAKDITVDDTDASIVYSPGWGENTAEFAYGGTHAVTQTVGATATFKFTGVAIYYIAPLWNFQVTTYVKLDDRDPVLVDMTDPNPPLDIPSNWMSKMSSAIWSATGLAFQSHTLVVSYSPLGNYGILDGLRCVTSQSPWAPNLFKCYKIHSPRPFLSYHYVGLVQLKPRLETQ
ncbi:hypothetical protein C8J57DRAFT_1058317 [Mycena rebaudengoi]|nr:hypothetical protein C8J57DRAFT_1058317 [Mycena rebaudengoi]